MFNAQPFPWILFKSKKDDTSLSNKDIKKLHKMISEKSKGLSGKKLEFYINKVNELFSNKHGDDWVDYKEI